MSPPGSDYSRLRTSVLPSNDRYPARRESQTEPEQGGKPKPRRAGVRRCAEMNKGASLVLLVVVGATVATPAAARGTETGASEAIVYERKGDLYAISVDGSRAVQLTRTRTQELEPAVSPDGRSIAYTRRRVRGQALGPWIGFVDNSGGELWTMNVDGTRRMRLTRGEDSDPAWSPDGETIFVTRVVGGHLLGSLPLDLPYPERWARAPPGDANRTRWRAGKESQLRHGAA